MTFHETHPNSSLFKNLKVDRSEHAENECLYGGTQNFVEWSKWDKLLREHSSTRGDAGPPEMILTTPPSSPESSPHSSPDMKNHHHETNHRHHRKHHHNDSHHSHHLSHPATQRAVSEGGYHHIHRHHHDDSCQYRHHHSSEKHLRGEQEPYLSSSQVVASRHDLLQPDFPQRASVEGALGRDFVKNHVPRRAMREGAVLRHERAWTEFDDEVGSYHLSNSSRHPDELGLPNTATDDQGFPSLERANSLPAFRSTQSESRYFTSRGAQYGGDMDNESSSGLKRWSPKRLMCGFQENEGAFPALPSPPEFSRSNHSVRSAPAYFPLESKRHDHLNAFHKHHHHHHHSSTMEFKQTMKKLLEEEYSPYDVSCTPSLLFRGENSCMAGKVSRRPKREWYERSDSKKGKMVSTKPRTMQLVFFESTENELHDMTTIPEEEELELHRAVDEMSQWV